MLTRPAPAALSEPGSFQALERQTVDRLREDVPGVEWVLNLATLGPYDYLDVFRAPDNTTAMKVSAVVRSYGHAHVEVWAAEEWPRFKELLAELPKR
jgi:uncharacterized protein with GYD domain